MNTLLWILVITFIDGLVALTGALTLLLSEKLFRMMLRLLVGPYKLASIYSVKGIVKSGGE